MKNIVEKYIGATPQEHDCSTWKQLRQKMLSELESELDSNSDNISDGDVDEIELEEPVGKYIIENSEHIDLEDGAYYHYRDVCRLVKNFKK